MSAFAFFTHLLEHKQLRKIWPFTNLIPDFAVNYCMKYLPAFKAYKIRKLPSNYGKEIEGVIINFSLLPGQIIEMNAGAILERVSAAVNSVRHSGVGIFGLGGLLSDKRYNSFSKLKLPITNGNYFTAWTAFEVIYRACKAKKINLKKSIVTVLGAHTEIGSLCARKLSYYASEIIISAGEENELKQIKADIVGLDTCAVTIEPDIRSAVNKTDILVIADSLFNRVINIRDFKSGCIVCDVSVVDNISGIAGAARKDIIIIEAGLVKIPYPVNFPFYSNLPNNIIPAALAETMLLAFEDKFLKKRFSDSNLENLEEIADLAAQHGFETWAPQAPLL